MKVRSPSLTLKSSHPKHGSGPSHVLTLTENPGVFIQSSERMRAQCTEERIIISIMHFHACSNKMKEKQN